MASRREFLKKAALSTLAIAAAPRLFARQLMPDRSNSFKPLLKKGDCILFYGDSITDGNRKRDDRRDSVPVAMGGGYAMSVASTLADKYPDMGLRFWNRGINGNKTFQMIDRLETDCFALKYKPTVVSILTGINDYSLAYVKTGKGDPEKYESELRTLLQRIRDRLPDVRFILLEPYALQGHREKIDHYLPDFYKYPPITKKIAAEFGAVFVPLQQKFDEAERKYGKRKFSTDGVHPYSAGIELVAREWLAAVDHGFNL